MKAPKENLSDTGTKVSVVLAPRDMERVRIVARRLGNGKTAKLSDAFRWLIGRGFPLFVATQLDGDFAAAADLLLEEEAA